MPKLEPSLQLALRRELENQCGYTVTNVRDCQMLLDEITSLAPNHRLGISTIRRFFGLVQHEGGFSSTSLNIFARHCGHPSFLDFQNSQKQSKQEGALSLLEQTNLRIQQIFERMTSSGQCPPEQLRDMVKASIRIQQNEAMADALWKLAHKEELTRKSYTELAPPFDYMASFGRHQMTDYLARATTEEERIFGEGLLAYGEAWTGDWTSCQQRIDRLTVDFDPFVHPFPQGRHWGLRLLVHSMKKDADGVKETLQALSDGLSHQETRGEIPFLQRVCTPFIALALGQRPDLAIQDSLSVTLARCAEGLTQWLDTRDPFIPSLEGIEPYRQMQLMAHSLSKPVEHLKTYTKTRGFQSGFASDKLIQTAQYHSIVDGIHPAHSKDARRAREIASWSLRRIGYPELGRLLADFTQLIRERK